MHVDRGSFLMLVATLAAGGGLGYMASEKNVVPHLDQARNKPPEPAAPEPPKPVVDAAAPATTPPPAPPPAPVCDDGVGTPGDCPPPGFPAAEGGCGSFAATRCAEFKQAMKPRVAQWAVECLNKLTPQERCDEKRVNLCGHLALMNGCPDRAPDAGETPVMSACLAIGQSCGPSTIAPSLAECRQVMNAMNDVGRDRMLQCMKKHCFDKGILYCEASTAK
jgi:hypothetical protein